jgi:hypothetical protein
VKRRWLQVFVLFMVLPIALGACGNRERPSVSDWRPTWDAIVDRLPSSSELGSPPDQEVCSRALGELRSLSPDLIPTPDLAVEQAVQEWVRVAEEMMFECPPSSDRIPDLESGYAELDRFEAEVDVVLGGLDGQA